MSKFYFNPQLGCIPILCAHSTEIILDVVLKDTTKSYPLMYIIGTTLSTNAHNRLLQSEFIFENAPYKLYYGTLMDKNTTQ